jgi:hypothetical protein
MEGFSGGEKYTISPALFHKRYLGWGMGFAHKSRLRDQSGPGNIRQAGESFSFVFFLVACGTCFVASGSGLRIICLCELCVLGDFALKVVSVPGACGRLGLVLHEAF